MKKRLIILGSTGSIGTKALEVVADFADEFEVVALSTNARSELLAEQTLRFRPQAICLRNSENTNIARDAAASVGARFHTGDNGLVELIDQYEADMVVVATVGFVGLLPTLRAIERRMTVALANKEVLVTAGHLVMEAARGNDVAILPIDSEHNAVFQCLNGCGGAAVRRIILTASGGPFRGAGRDTMQSITPEAALRHPTWNMGPKITIDSATLMNKGFEVMEAAHLFGIPASRVDVLVHPQSTVHSMVEYVDGSIIAQMGTTDMYLPIQNVLMYPERRPNRFAALDLARLGTLTFEQPDLDSFPCLRYAYDAAERGGTYPAVLNAANEVAVARFLAEEIPFLGIPETVYDALQAHDPLSAETLDQIQAADRWAREHARQRQFA
ncbi:MAG: 1-deoxy-D-xylulose-5-phosphate reductoisomerase [Candidatus Sumerlaeaceae bacterium]